MWKSCITEVSVFGKRKQYRHVLEDVADKVWAGPSSQAQNKESLTEVGVFLNSSSTEYQTHCLRLKIVKIRSTKFARGSPTTRASITATRPAISCLLCSSFGTKTKLPHPPFNLNVSPSDSFWFPGWKGKWKKCVEEFWINCRALRPFSISINDQIADFFCFSWTPYHSHPVRLSCSPSWQRSKARHITPLSVSAEERGRRYLL